MGRRSFIEEDLWPIRESLIEVVAESGPEGLGFTEIVRRVEEKGISRATVARYLPRLVEKGILRREASLGGRPRYKLGLEAIHEGYTQRLLFSILSMHLFNEILEEASAGRLSDEEFTKLFTWRIGVLAMYTMLKGLEWASGAQAEDLRPRREEAFREAGRWIEEGFGTLIQKDGWRTCLNRQIFRGPVKLKKVITLKEPLMPEIILEDGSIYIRRPGFVERGLAEQVLKEMPPIPQERLKELKMALERLYPEETHLLDQVSALIDEAARIGKRR